MESCLYFCEGVFTGLITSRSQKIQEDRPSRQFDRGSWNRFSLCCSSSRAADWSEFRLANGIEVVKGATRWSSRQSWIAVTYPPVRTPDDGAERCRGLGFLVTTGDSRDPREREKNSVDLSAARLWKLVYQTAARTPEYCLRARFH